MCGLADCCKPLWPADRVMFCWDSTDKITPRLRIHNLSNPSIMYCNTYVNTYDAIGSVIPCEIWHKHRCFHSSATAAWSTWGSLRTGATLSVSWNRNFANKEVRLLHSLVRCRLKRSNFWVKLNRLLWVCSPTQDMKQSGQNQHVGYFHMIGSATIRRNLIGLPLPRSYYT